MNQPNSAFDYHVAFGRNLGLVTGEEVERLRRSRVLVAGLGGLGGYYAVALARAGVGAMTLTDIDQFEAANFNRQYGASLSTVGRSKLEVMAEVVRDINPEIELRLEPRGVSEQTIDGLLDDVDLVMNAIELFEVDVHQLLVDRAMAAGQVALFAAPLGYSAAMVAFGPKGMPFTDYFAITPKMSPLEKVVQFALGTAPAGLHLGYLDLGSVDLEQRRGPSFAGACLLCGGIASTEALMLLLDRKTPDLVPHYQQIDLCRGRWARGRLRWGNRGPLQRLKRAIVMHRYRRTRLAAEAQPLLQQGNQR